MVSKAKNLHSLAINNTTPPFRFSREEDREREREENTLLNKVRKQAFNDMNRKQTSKQLTHKKI